MSRVLNYVLFVIIGFLIFWGVSQCYRKTEYKRKSTSWHAMFDSCLNVKPQVKIEKVPVYLKDTGKIEPIPEYVYAFGDTLFDTVVRDTCGVCLWYKESYTKGDSIQIDWSAMTYGTIDWIRFDLIRYPSTKATLTRTIPIDRPIPITKSHLWAYLKPQMAIKPFDVSSVTLGLVYTRKDKWGVGGGIGYDWTINKPIAEIQGLIKLK